MNSPYTNTKPIDDNPGVAQKLIKLGCCLVAISLSLAAIASVISAINPQENTSIETPAALRDLSELTDIKAFTQAYLSARGDLRQIESTKTMRASGYIINGDNQQPFSLIKKRPDQLLFTIDHGSHKMTVGVSGDTVWRRIRAAQHEDLLTLIEGDEANHWLAQRRFFDRIIDACQGKGAITMIETATSDGTDCLKVQINDTENKTAEILVDPQTLYPIVERRSMPNGQVKQIRFSDYRNVNGIPIAFEAIISIDDQPLNKIRLDNMSLNPGVLSTVFNAPESLLTKE
jgi:hypothetical protein